MENFFFISFMRNFNTSIPSSRIVVERAGPRNNHWFYAIHSLQNENKFFKFKTLKNVFEARRKESIYKLRDFKLREARRIIFASSSFTFPSLQIISFSLSRDLVKRMKEVGDFREIFIEEKSFGRDEKKVIQRAITKETESRWEVVRKPLDNSGNNVESDIIQFFHPGTV